MKSLPKILLIFLFAFISCEKKKNITIGFPFPLEEDEWGKLLHQEINHQFNYNVTLVEKDAGRQKEKQLKDFIELYNFNTDILQVIPFDTLSIKDKTEKIYAKKIPIILILKKLNTNKFSTFIRYKNITFRAENEYYKIKLKEKNSVMTIAGNYDCHLATNRIKGFTHVIKDCFGITSDSNITVYSPKKLIQHYLYNIINTGNIPDFIFSYNDRIANWTYEICSKYNIFPFMIGIDELPTPNRGIRLVEKKYMDMTFFNGPSKEFTIKSAFDIFKEKTAPKIQTHETFPINKQKIKLIQDSLYLTNNISKNLLKQRKQIEKLSQQIKEQRLLLIIFTFSIIFILALASLLYFIIKQKYSYIKLIENKNNKTTQHLEKEQTLSEELARQNGSLKLHKKELELLVKERTLKLEIALKKAEESDNLKSSFLSNFSHEVRTPLNSIIGFSHLLSREETDKKSKKLFLQHIKNGGLQLLKIIDDLVEISIINTENIKINYQETNIIHILNETFNFYKVENTEILNQKANTVTFTLNLPENRIIKTDSYRIKQLLGYLLDNAFKFTHKGSVEMGCIVKENDKARIYVKDSGIGIDPKNFEYIFKNFVKIEEDKDILYRGTGLGLSIAQRLAKILNTYIHIESTLGKGSVFYFDLSLPDKSGEKKHLN